MNKTIHQLLLSSMLFNTNIVSNGKTQHTKVYYCLRPTHGIMWQPWPEPGVADGCHTAIILTTTLSLIPIPAVPSTKGQWEQNHKTVVECPFRQQCAASAQYNPHWAHRQPAHSFRDLNPHHCKIYLLNSNVLYCIDSLNNSS